MHFPLDKEEGKMDWKNRSQKILKDGAIIQVVPVRQETQKYKYEKRNREVF